MTPETYAHCMPMARARTLFVMYSSTVIVDDVTGVQTIV